MAKTLSQYVLGDIDGKPALLRHPLRELPVLRCGIVGFGAMGRNHAQALQHHPYLSLAAICSRQTSKRADAADFNCRWFDTPEEMIASGAIDVLIITTPHWQHADLTVAALQSGLHVICEKPLSVTVAQADAVVRAVKKSQKMFTVVFQTRLEEVFQRAKRILDSGQLGPILRCQMVETYWRSDAYYRSSPWRASWKGEGGGVLLNQAAHLLDRYIWLCGMPETVAAFCDTVIHPIEVEDTASALLRHPQGYHGHIHSSTSENPGISRVLIACDRGRITIQNGAMRVEWLPESIRTHTAKAGLQGPSLQPRVEEFEASPMLATQDALWLVYENFAFAVAGIEPLAVSVEVAARSVELANAMMLSSARGCIESLPVDRRDYDAFMAGKLAESDEAALQRAAV